MGEKQEYSIVEPHNEDIHEDKHDKEGEYNDEKDSVEFIFNESSEDKQHYLDSKETSDELLNILIKKVKG